MEFMARRISGVRHATGSIPGTNCCTPGTEQTVLDYVAAFNRHDVDGMLRLATDKILWLSVSGETVIRETADAQALDAAMRDYF